MNRIHSLVIVFIFLFHTLNLHSQDSKLVSVSQETQVLTKGSKSIFKCEIFYNKENDAVVTHHFYPVEFVKIANRFGEVKIYFPETNSVTVKQDKSLSTTNELYYYFINNKITDLGLSKEGFSLISTSREEGLIVTTWQAPPSLKTVYQVKIVFSEGYPVFSEYHSLDGSILKKIYYSRYTDFKTFRMPLRITEISFNNKSDSTISLSVFSNIRTSDFPADSYFNFKIPDDAKVGK
jgi:hypothetical protein